MKFFDLHCDTIEELRKRGEDYVNNTTQFSVRDLDKFEKAVQTMAVFVPDDIRGEAAVRFVDDYYNYMNEQAAKYPDKIGIIESISDIDRICGEHKWAFLRSIESGACLNGDLDNIDHFASLNFKMLGLVWNGANELGSGPNNDTGLTDFGKEAVKRMEKVGMIVDCSHLNDAGFEDLLNVSEKPFVASHSNVRACCSHPRNLRDDQFKEIVRRGGLCGINIFSKFLNEKDERNKEDIFRHIYHMLELGGEDVIAWGTDFDGEVTNAPEVNDPYRIGLFAEYLEKMGIKKDVIEKIYFDNAYNFFMKNVK